MDWLNNIKEGLKSGYNSFDNTIGGVLPGGAPLDLGNLGGEVIRDIQKAVVPGWGGGRVVDKAVSRTAATQDDLVTGNIPGVAATLTGNVTGSKGREFVIDEIMDALGKKMAKTGVKKFGSKLAGFIPGGQGVALADTGNDLRDIYSTVLQATTGKTLGNIQQYMKV